MRINKIKIENYRGILNEEIEFNDKVNVFIGGNGAGKTTLLEAIVASLLKFTNSFLLNPTYTTRYYLSEDSINYNKRTFSINQPFASILLEADFLNQHLPIFNKVGIKQSTDKEAKYKKQYQAVRSKFNDKLGENSFSLPIVKYYAANRGAVKYSNNIPIHIYNQPQLESWANFIYYDISYSRFFKWFWEYETSELRMQKELGNFNFKNLRIEGIRKAINKAFKKLNGKDYTIKSSEIKRIGANDLIPILELQDKQNPMHSENLDSKSDGEKAIITLIADIAYNLSIAHNFSSEDNDFLKSSGVVLIDEIEAHLHPNWQRKIIPLLTELFPNIQFFIATHSPQVLASVNSENIFVGENFKFEKINIKTKGMDSNTLLKYVFNATERPKQYMDLIAKFREMMDAEKKPEELQLVINEIVSLEKEDNGTDVSQLISDLNLELEAYKFDLEYETN